LCLRVGSAPWSAPGGLSAFTYTGSDAPQLVAIAIATVPLLWPVALMVTTFQIIGHFPFHHLLHHPLDAQTDDLGCDVFLLVQSLTQKAAESP
jgi:hypothetical protein